KPKIEILATRARRIKTHHKDSKRGFVQRVFTIQQSEAYIHNNKKHCLIASTQAIKHGPCQ
ncbi:MAG: hypothetical protein ACKV0T_23945, partial [Planctomycetales bacterium]